MGLNINKILQTAVGGGAPPPPTQKNLYPRLGSGGESGGERGGEWRVREVRVEGEGSGGGGEGEGRPIRSNGLSNVVLHMYYTCIHIRFCCRKFVRRKETKKERRNEENIGERGRER